MAGGEQTPNELERALAESVATLLAKHAERARRIDQTRISQELADRRAVSRAHRRDKLRKVMIGNAVLAEAEANPEFRIQLNEILARRAIDYDFAAGGDDK